MAWAQTRDAIRDVVLLVVGSAGLLHEFFLAAAERPVLVGASLACLGLSLTSGVRR